ncbi:MAG: hypothetical protein M1814_003470 [Vezdaea aestivalis]|nr:MAG: hypothetical protein M1814_003470 [Vezdaea aestivalis]
MIFITDTIKNLVGRPRPDLLDRCKPKSSTPKGQLVTFEVCTETNHHVLHDGWRSFPSGHSSLSFSGLGYLSIFLCGQLRIFQPGADLVKGIMALAPLIGALYIATSRLEDYRHDFYDVTIGSVLGYSIALLSYRRYYPRLRSPTCDIPHQSRAAAEESGGFRKIKSDEETGALGRISIDDPDEDSEAIPLKEDRRLVIGDAHHA